MIKKLANALYNPTKTMLVTQRFSGAHGPAPTKLKKVEEVAINFNVKNSDGQWEQIKAFVGQPFLNSILRMKVKGSFNHSLCLGNDTNYRPHERPHDPFSEGPTCGMCRIVLRDNWFDKINVATDGMTVKQAFALDLYPDARKYTRLACCLPVQQWMDGCTFQIYAVPEISELTDVE